MEKNALSRVAASTRNKLVDELAEIEATLVGVEFVDNGRASPLYSRRPPMS